MIKANIITLVNNHQSTVATRTLIESIKKTKSEIDPLIFPATTPLSIPDDLKKSSFIDADACHWSYPNDPSQDGLDMKTGLRLTHYPTRDPARRVACMISHMRCWQDCIDRQEDMIIFEHDALVTKQIKIKELTKDFHGGIIGLNNPIGATRRAQMFDEIAKQRDGLQPVPTIDDLDVPQGLAGNSAYYIQPAAAKKLLRKVEEIGMWPNDALMNKQFFPWLKIVYPYYTTIQKGLKSTTTQ